MYKFVIVTVIALFVLQGAIARPKAKQETAAAPAPAKKSQIEELAGTARQVVQNVSQAIEGNLPDSKQVSESITNTSQTIATNVKDVIDNLAKQAKEHEGDLRNFFNTVKDNLKSATSKLETTIGPEATKNANEAKANLDVTVNKIISEAERLAKAAEPEAGKVKAELNDAAKNLLDNVVDVVKNLQTELNKHVGAKN